MIRISRDEYIGIRNRVDHITEHLIEDGDMTVNSSIWLISTIKDLLLDVYLLQHEIKSHNNEACKTRTYYAIKKNCSDKYFEGAWECHSEDEKNYSFTSDLSRAQVFYRHSLDSPYGAPKYLWDEERERIIRTLDEMCEYFNCSIVKVAKEELWREVR